MSIEFDGSTEYFELTGTDITSNFTGYPMSFCAQHYLSSLSGAQTLFSIADDSVDNKYLFSGYRGDWTNYRGHQITVNNATPLIQARTNANSAYSDVLDHDDITPSTASWLGWIAGCAVSNSILFFWVDNYGVFYSRKSSVGGEVAWFSPDLLTIGRLGRLTKSQYFNGRLAHVAVWNNYQLTFKDIQRLADGALPTELGSVSDAGLFDYWAMDGTSGSAGNQTGINGNVLTANGTPVYAANPTISGRSTATLSILIRDKNGAPLTNKTGLSWSYYTVAPAAFFTDYSIAAQTGSGASTDASGNFSVTSITGPGVAANQTGFLVITDSDGDATRQSVAFAAPVELT